MCDQAVNDSLAALKLITDWLVTSKIIKKIFTDLYADEDILYINEDSGDAGFIYDEMDVVNVNLNNINVDNNFDEEDPNNIIHNRLLPWHTKLGKCKKLKKELNKKLILVAWHPKRWHPKRNHEYMILYIGVNGNTKKTPKEVLDKNSAMKNFMITSTKTAKYVL